MADDRTPAGDRDGEQASLWPWVHRVGAVLVALAAVPYALVVATTPLEPAAPSILRELGLPPATTLARALTAATCGLLAAAALGAAVIVRRLAPPWVVLTAGMAALAAGALWVRSVDSVAQLAALRGVQGAGAGAVVVASVALVGTVGGRARTVLSAALLVAVLAGSAALPWATYRLPFAVGSGWRDVVAPYPVAFMLALAGTAAVAVAALAARTAAGDAGAGDEQAGRLGWPLVLPAGVGAGAYLLRPAAAGQMLTLHALLLLTTVVVVLLAGVAVVRAVGWRAAVTPALVVVVAAVLTVTSANAFSVALFADARWPLPTAHVLPALGGAALAGSAACVAAAVSPRRLRRFLTTAGLLAAAVGVLLPLSTGVAVTSAGTVLVWAGAGLALGAAVEWTGAAAGTWCGAATVTAAILAGVVSTALRATLTPSTSDAAAAVDRLAALHDGFLGAQRITIAACALLLAGGVVLVARLGRAHVQGEGSPAEPRREDVAGTGDVPGPDEGEDEDVQRRSAPASAPGTAPAEPSRQ
jgi:hypothetical protein